MLVASDAFSYQRGVCFRIGGAFAWSVFDWEGVLGRWWRVVSSLACVLGRCAWLAVESGLMLSLYLLPFPSSRSGVEATASFISIVSLLQSYPSARNQMVGVVLVCDALLCSACTCGSGLIFLYIMVGWEVEEGDVEGEGKKAC